MVHELLVVNTLDMIPDLRGRCYVFRVKTGSARPWRENCPSNDAIYQEQADPVDARVDDKYAICGVQRNAAFVPHHGLPTQKPF